MDLQQFIDSLAEQGNDPRLVRLVLFLLSHIEVMSLVGIQDVLVNGCRAEAVKTFLDFKVPPPWTTEELMQYGHAELVRQIMDQS